MVKDPTESDAELPREGGIRTLPAYGFREAPAFTRHVYDYWTDAEYAAFQWYLAQDPTCGDVIPGTNGVRKIRWRDPRRKKGKRGGVRVIYFIFVDDAVIFLLTIYDKDELGDLDANGKKAAKKLVEEEQLAQAERRRKKGAQ